MIQPHTDTSHTAFADAARIGAAAPKTLAVVHYGPDGVAVATTGRATYPSASPTELTYASFLAGGAPHANSTITLGAGGAVSTAATTLLNADGSTRKQLAADYAGLVMNAAGRPQSGRAKFSVSDPDGTPSHAAELAYANELVDSYSVDVFDRKQGNGALAGRLVVGFGKVERQGTRLTGGELALSWLKNGVTLDTASRSLLGAQGTPLQVLATSYGADAVSVRQLVRSDYTGIVFDARGKILSGQLLVTLQAPDGTPRSSSVFSYTNGKLIGSRALRPAETIARAAREAGQRGAIGPWTPTRPADRSKRVTRADGSLLERRDDWFAIAGNPASPPWRTLITGFAADGSTVIRVTDIDFRAASFDPAGQPRAGTVVSTRFEGGIRASTSNLTY